MPNICELSAQYLPQYLLLRKLALATEPLAFGLCSDDALPTGFPQDRTVFLAVNEGEIIGMAALCPEKTVKRIHKARVGEVFVLPAHRGQGISKLLLTEVIGYARRLLLRKLQLTVNTIQMPARKLYAQFGFYSAGIMREEIFVNGRYYDMEIMELLL